ncbi:MAG: histidine kinase [Geobacteraceae bacterium GWC2_58_44]|nr:MAG: histidine kinase [Geobacteraceae bacterium GWC2_58_44]
MSYVHHTVLVVDNNEDEAHFTRLALQRVGVISPVQTVSDAEEALSYLTGQGSHADPESRPPPVLLLLDLQLPGISGLELLAWLRRQPVLKRLPVIVLTSAGEPGQMNRAYELGCNSYLVKPSSFNALLVMMQSLVQYWLSLNENPEVWTAAGSLRHADSAPEGAWRRDEADLGA